MRRTAVTVNLSIVILTLNEEVNLPFTLASLSGMNARIFVVDAGSDDRTCEIATQAGCEVLFHPFETHARQLNWAIDNLDLGDWVLRLDADERLTDELKSELLARLPALPADVTGLMVKRRVF